MLFSNGVALQGLLRLTSIDIYTMTSSRQDADAIIQSLSALRDAGEIAQVCKGSTLVFTARSAGHPLSASGCGQGQSSPFIENPSSSQQPDDQDYQQVCTIFEWYVYQNSRNGHGWCGLSIDNMRSNLEDLTMVLGFRSKKATANNFPALLEEKMSFHNCSSIWSRLAYGVMDW